MTEHQGVAGSSEELGRNETPGSWDRLRVIGTALIVAAVAFAYSNSLHAPFVFDDDLSIVRNPIVHDLSYFARPWRVDASVAPQPLVYGFHSRYLAFLTFALNWAVHGRDVLGYHLVNLAIHLGSLLALLALVRTVLGLPRFAGSRARGRETPIALVAGALFALHPLQTQAVTYVVQRMASLAGLLCLLSLLAYVRARSMPAGTRRLLLTTGCLLALVAAMATKQNAFAFPLVLISAELVLFRSEARKRWKWLAIPLVCLLFVAPLLHLRTGHAAPDPRPSFESTRPGQTLTSSAYRSTQPRVLATYLRLFILPVNQALDYDYPASTSWLEPGVLGSSALLASLLATGVWLSMSRRGRDPAWRLVGFGIVWFFVMHAVESSGIAVLDLIFEHRMYLPSVGLCLALAVAAVVGTPPRSANVAMAGLAAAALALGATTYARNEVWRSELRLWKDALAKQPRNVRALSAVGDRLLELRRVDEAEQKFRRALELEPDRVGVIVQLGVVAQIRRDPARAEPFFRHALELEPTHWIAAIHLGDLLYQRSDPTAAEKLWTQAAKHEQLSTYSRRRLERLRAGLDPLEGRVRSLAPAGTSTL